MDFRPFFCELVKLSAISDEEAERALNRYEGLKENKPGLGQIARYSALGAVASPMMTAGEGLIKGENLKNLVSRAEGKGTLRAIAGRAVGGAVGMGLVPIARHMMDQSAERSKLKHYLQEHAGQEKVALAANLVPVPGAHPAYVAGKKALERGIDRFLPVPAT